MITNNKEIIFIDLDSTLIKTLSGGPFAKCIADCTPIWKTWNALRDWAKNKTNGYVLIVSNQGGIEKGISSKENYIIDKFNFITSALREYLGEHITVDYIYCPSNDPSNQNRKPNTGMYSEILNRWNLESEDKNLMVMIGDASPKSINPKSFSTSDYDSAVNFGIDYLDVNEV